MLSQPTWSAMQFIFKNWHHKEMLESLDEYNQIQFQACKQIIKSMGPYAFTYDLTNDCIQFAFFINQNILSAKNDDIQSSVCVNSLHHTDQVADEKLELSQKLPPLSCYRPRKTLA